MFDYIYLIWTPSYPLFIKLGISYNPDKRAADIAKSISKREKTRVLFAMKCPFAYWSEQLFHAMFFWCNCRFFISKKVSGHTEFVILPIGAVFGFVWIILNSIWGLIGSGVLAAVFYNYLKS